MEKFRRKGRPSLGLLALTLSGIALSLAAVVAAMPAASGQAAGPCVTANASVSPSESSLVAGINAWRGSALSQPPMALSGAANLAAQIHADAIVAGTAGGHADSYGRSWDDRLIDCGYTPQYALSSGEAEALFTSVSAGTVQDALASITASQPNHQNGVQAPVAWKCVGVGYASSTTARFKHAWVVVVAMAPSTTACPGGSQTGSPPASTTTTNTSTPTNTATPTKTPTPSPTPRGDGATLTLYQGWNLVTLPEGPVAEVLHRAQGCYRAIYQQDGSRWLRYSPEVPAYANNLQTLNGGTFWIEGTAENCGLVPL